MKKTAVEWLYEQLKINNYISENAYWVINEAKEMEKQQIIDARIDIYTTGDLSAEQYYNKTFKS